MGLGRFSDVDIDQARIQAYLYRTLAKNGTCPITYREQQRQKNIRASEQAKEILSKRKTIPSFRSYANDFIEFRKKHWKNKKHAQQWTNTLNTYAMPFIGDKPIDTISIEDIIKILQPIWHSIPITAERLRGRIETILTAAYTQHQLEIANPARYKNHLNAIFTSPNISRIKKAKS